MRLHRQVDKSALVIVEGKSDERFLKKAFPSARATYFPAGSRTIATSAAIQLKEWSQQYYLCVVDRDFDTHIEEVEAKGAAIYAYENADLEAMAAVSGAAIDIIEELGSEAKVASRGGAMSVLASLYTVVTTVAILRRANAENNWGLAFDKVELASKIDKRTLQLNLQPYCAALHGTSESSPGQGTLLKYASGVKPLNRDLDCPRGSKPYFRGKDLLVVLSVALCGFCGTRKTQSVVPDVLEAMLRFSGAAIVSNLPWGNDYAVRVAQLAGP